MKVGAITMILPRMELFHLPHWIDHLRKNEFDKVWIFCEPELSHDNCYSDNPSITWKKKPEADYNLHLTSSEAIECVREIAAEAMIEVEVLISGADAAAVGIRQSQVCYRLLNRLKSNEERAWDWMTFLDVDEYLVVPEGRLEDVLHSIPSQFSRVQMQQKVFYSRWNNGAPIDISSIGDNYGVCNFNHKYFFRPSKLKKFGNVHNSPDAYGKKFAIDPTRLRFHHFRGSPDSIGGARRLGALPRYVKLKDRPVQPLDFSHQY